MLLGCDLSQLDAFTLNLLTNDEVLAIDQDEGGHQAQRVLLGNGYEVWVKPLSDGGCAVGIFNMEDICQKVRFTWASLGLDRYHTLRDVWRQHSEGNLPVGFEGMLMPHGVLLYTLK